ncbi:MAG: hypothetical protein ACXW2E_01345 [Nitrososphaeraceae archaeon]
MKWLITLWFVAFEANSDTITPYTITNHIQSILHGKYVISISNELSYTSNSFDDDMMFIAHFPNDIIMLVEYDNSFTTVVEFTITIDIL